MIAYLKRFKKVLIPILIVYIYLGMLLIPKTNYNMTTEGGLTNVNKTFVFEDELAMSNNFSTIFVYSYHRVTPFQRWLLDKSNRYEISKKSSIEQTLTNKEISLRGQISKLSGHEQSLIAAYTYAIKTNVEESLGLDIEIDYKFDSLMVYYASNYLEIGDFILGVNDTKFDGALSFEEAVDVIRNTSKPFTLNVKRDDEEVDVVINDSLSLSLYPRYNIINTVPKINHLPPKSNVGGSSGGLMQTLSLYASLLQLDLGNVKISGTGTMEIGSELKVGRIGGIVQKFYTARTNKVDYLFVPVDYKLEPDNSNTHFSKSEWKEISKIKKSFKDVFYVATFEEAVEAFNEEILSKVK